MPTYEYLCQSCGKRFEAWQKITDDPIRTCPNCSGEVHRVIYPVGLMFKGSGFYITDNRGSSSAASGANGHASSSEKGEKSGEGAAASSEKADAKTGAEKSASATPAAGGSD
jgi:putative FmdB family regulatory protein